MPTVKKVIQKLLPPGEHRRVSAFYVIGKIRDGLDYSLYTTSDTCDTYVMEHYPTVVAKDTLLRILNRGIRVPVNIGEVRCDELCLDGLTPVRTFETGNWYAEIKHGKVVSLGKCPREDDMPIQTASPVGVDVLTGIQLPIKTTYPVIQLKGEDVWVVDYVGRDLIETAKQLHALLKRTPQDFIAIPIRGECKGIHSQMNIVRIDPTLVGGLWSVDGDKLLYSKYRGMLYIKKLVIDPYECTITGTLFSQTDTLDFNRAYKELTSGEYMEGSNYRARIPCVMSPNGLYYRFDDLKHSLLHYNLLKEAPKPPPKPPVYTHNTRR